MMNDFLPMKTMKPKPLSRTGLIIVLALMSGCATTVMLETPAAVADHTSLKVDEYKKTKTIETVRFYTGKHMMGRYHFRALLGASDEVETYQLYVYETRSSADGWAFFTSAVDIDGNQLSFLPIDREVMKNGGGWTQEHMAIGLDRAYLDKAAINGINVRLDGQRASLVVKVPAVQVAGFLMKVDQLAP